MPVVKPPEKRYNMHAMNPHADKPRILTGDTPTGSLHLGHYVGSLENRVQLQEHYDCFFIVANVHALTTRPTETTQIRADTLNILKDWISVGMDPRKSTFFLQSEVPAIAELTWYFAMLLGYGRLMKNPTIKDEIRVKGLGDQYSFGFLMYAVGQIADILSFTPALVPVGEDQIPHIEMTREIARRFNQVYCGVDPNTPDEDHLKAGGVFPVPQAKIGRIARLTGIDGQNKMSKSLGNAIFLNDDPKTVQKKCSKIFTGRGTMDDPPVIEGNTVLEYVRIFCAPGTPGRAAELEAAYAGSELGDGALKKEVAGAINAFLEPIRERRNKLTDADIMDVIREGNQKANAAAEQTLWRAKEAMQYNFHPRKLGF